MSDTELVALLSHRILWTKKPYVTVEIDGHHVATVQLELTVVLDVNSLVAGVRGGQLVELHGGNCDVTASLAIQGVEVAEQQGYLDLPGVVPLGRGIPLV